MKKIRESFHMIAAAVFCLVMSVKAIVLKEMGQAVGLSAGALGYVPGVQNVAGNTTDSSMYRTASEHDNYIISMPRFRAYNKLTGYPPRNYNRRCNISDRTTREIHPFFNDSFFLVNHSSCDIKE